MGHYCKICGRIRADEKFSGKGHRNHVCKDCSKKPAAERDKLTAMNRMYMLYQYSNLSKNNRKMLQKYLQSDSEEIRNVTKEILDHFHKLREGSLEYGEDTENVYNEQCDDLLEAAP
ncbi:hypothetical protein BR63_17490 [Thermanaerosceptrum fracticalcis]|uniref:Uncharacterized protein n=1 Tax=Thermanaerosceptrum fracticalcis TaxID=1712410 RepID=A0A7G6E738_THEFR|nr:hypothetical protein [Thermanaerosceptrum fracticalcis]QNB47892.1 hypothetical protein BR63_17490 [Thermanaerosceptrum fracticalcis]